MRNYILRPHTSILNIYMKMTIHVVLGNRSATFCRTLNLWESENGVALKGKEYISLYVIVFKSTNLNNKKYCSYKSLEEYRKDKVKHWSLPSFNWLKWNTNKSRIEAKHSSMIGFVCRDNTGRVQHVNGKTIGDCPILVIESLQFEKQI